MINFHISMMMALLLYTATAQADWTTLRGNPQRTGYIDTEIKAPFHTEWVCHFAGERFGTAMEPIVADGKVFVATHNGRLYALDALTGQLIWSFQAHGAFLHSPAYADNIVIVANTDGYIYALNGSTGEIKWSHFTWYGGISSSPLIADGAVYVGCRDGVFIGLDLLTGSQKSMWGARFEEPYVPIRQTSSYYKNKIYITTEGLHVQCIDTKGKHLWTSDALVGQTARDYYPVITEVDGRAYVIIRTNPAINMAKLIGQDRRFICESAGVDDSDWKKLEEWTKSEDSIGTPGLWADEQDTIIQYLEDHPEAQTFFVLDAETGKKMDLSPVLWCAGCQGVGTPPVVMPDGKLLVFYRSVYGNWNMGVAPLVALGLLDLETMYIEPLKHKHGMQPLWNTFWGTADESQNFVVAGNTLLIVHQDTLSGFDMKTKELFLIAGNRDSWGGFKNLPYARNEWHGPARGGVAVVGNRIYWMTGSRIICIVSGEQGQNAEDVEINATDVKITDVPAKTPDQRVIDEVINFEIGKATLNRWAPFVMEPGLAGTDFAFDNSGDTFEALSWAYPYLTEDPQDMVKDLLEIEWTSHPPFSQPLYDLNEGERREYHNVLSKPLTGTNTEKPPRPFGNIYAVKLYADRCNEWSRVLSSWKDIKASFDDFVKSGWKLIPENGDLYANRYLSSLMAYADIADKAGDKEAVNQVKPMIDQTTDALIQWWKLCSQKTTMPIFKDVSELDSFIGKGDALFFQITPHRSKIALFHNMTPEIAKLLRSRVPDEINNMWKAFVALCPTWYIVGEERQVHYGENYIDLPDFNIDAFKAFAWLQDSVSTDQLAERLDIPLCRADLNYIMKLSIIISQQRLNTETLRHGENIESMKDE
jgi:hypothetical protein